MSINIRELRDKETRELFYPKTHVSAVVGLADQSFFECVIVDGSPTIKVKDEYAGLWANGWMASGGVGSGGGGGGGLITSVKGISALGTPIATESLTETFSAKAIESIWEAVVALQNSTPNVSLTNRSTYYDLAVNGTTIPLYTKLQVDGLIGAINQFHYEIYASTSAVTSPSANVLYLIGPTGTGADKYEEYVYANNAWTKIGDTTIDLSGYALASDIPTALSQLSTDSTHRLVTDSQISAWNAKYDKPSGGIPKSDLASAVQTSLGKADSALQSETDPVYSAWITSSRTRNTVFAAPSSANGAPSFRALVASDIPSLTISKISDAESWITGKGYALKAGGIDYNFQVDSLIVSDGGTLDGTTYSGKPVLRFSYRYTDESSMIPTIVSETKYLAYKDEIPTDYVKTSGAQQVSGVKTFLANIRGGAASSVNWQITTAGAATFASLTVGGNAVTPANYVTLDGAQTISGAKTFSAQMTASSGITLGGSILPNSDSSVNFGDSSHRFAGGNIRNLYVTNQTFVDGTTPSTIHGGIYCGDGLMQWQLGANAAGGFLTFGQTTGFFHNGNGAVPLGRSDHGWGNIYIANNKALTSADTNGNSRELLKLANNDWLYIGNNGIPAVQLNATGYIKMYWDSGDAYASFGAGANAYFPNLLPNGTSGTKNLGSASERWNNIYGVNANLSGNLSLSGTTKRIYFGDTYYIELVNIGTTASPLYALHTNAPLYSDGFIAAGGVQQTS